MCAATADVPLGRVAMAPLERVVGRGDAPDCPLACSTLTASFLVPTLDGEE